MGTVRQVRGLKIGWVCRGVVFWIRRHDGYRRDWYRLVRVLLSAPKRRSDSRSHTTPESIIGREGIPVGLLPARLPTMRARLGPIG
jgi:hypothetical protein